MRKIPDSKKLDKLNRKENCKFIKTKLQILLAFFLFILLLFSIHKQYDFYILFESEKFKLCINAIHNFFK